MLARLCLFASVATASATLELTLELTADNWKSEVTDSGKTAFIKFMAPWCGHCKNMKRDWDELAQEYKESDKFLIADVDCTANDAKKLCTDRGVKSFPTLKFFAPGDNGGKDYGGGRKLADLQEFAKSELSPCTVDTLENCSPEQKAALKKYMAMSPAELADKIAVLTKTLRDAEAAHKELLEDLQTQYKVSTDQLEELKVQTTPEIKMLKAALPASYKF